MSTDSTLAFSAGNHYPLIQHWYYWHTSILSAGNQYPLIPHWHYQLEISVHWFHSGIINWKSVSTDSTLALLTHFNIISWKSVSTDSTLALSAGNQCPLIPCWYYQLAISTDFTLASLSVGNQPNLHIWRHYQLRISLISIFGTLNSGWFQAYSQLALYENTMQGWFRVHWFQTDFTELSRWFQADFTLAVKADFRLISDWYTADIR